MKTSTSTAAYTLPGSNYPGYINVTRDGGHVTIILRAEATEYMGNPQPGLTTELRIPESAWNFLKTAVV